MSEIAHIFLREWRDNFSKSENTAVRYSKKTTREVVIQSFTKQIYEKFPIAGDFSNVMERGETIVLTGDPGDDVSEVSVLDADGVDATASIIVTSSLEADDTNHYLICKVQGGEVAKSPYTITMQAVTSEENYWELDFKMYVKEVPE